MFPRRILFLAPAQTVTRVFPELRDAGFEVGIAENVKGASAFFRKGMPGVIFSRPLLPGYKVGDLLAVGRDDPNFPPVVVFSERATPEEAASMLEMGARDYWPEPLSFEKITACFPSRRAPHPAPASSTLGGRAAVAKGHNIVGKNEKMTRVLALARQVAKSKATVLISGESGTGKEMFSRFLHAHSDRADNPFVAINCAALPEHLLESELFGHEKGAFTGAIGRKLGKFELASTGTLLLDEISEMDLGLQAKLLRVLQEGEIDRVGGTETVKVDVRVLATTNRDLQGWVEQGKFRQDLFFRLNVIPLRLPSLKERGDDVLDLAAFFIDMYVRDYGLSPAMLAPEAVEWLKAYAWPGNVRELQNLMERAVLLCGGQPIAPRHFLLEGEDWPLFTDDEAHAVDEPGPGKTADLAKHPVSESFEGTPRPAALANGAGSAPGAAVAFGGQGDAQGFEGAVIPLHEMERIMILKGLEHTSGNRTQAAELLGISVRTLRNKLNEYRMTGLEVD